MPRAKRPRFACSVCAGKNLVYCPACGGSGRASCHRCQSPIFVGDWVALETLKTPGCVIRVFFCLECSKEIGLHVGPSIRRVA